MKKIILIFIIILVIPILIIKDSGKNYDYYINNFPDLPKDEKWEYVRVRIFDGYSTNIHKYDGPILCELYNATAKDSLAFQEILEELRVLLPNKEIDYFKNYAGANLEEFLSSQRGLREIKGYDYKYFKKYTIRLNFAEIKNEDDKLNLLDGYNKQNHNSLLNIASKTNNSSFEKWSNLFFPFPTTFTLNDRKKIIEKDFIRNIAFVNYFQPNQITKRVVDSKESLLNEKESVHENYHFSELDKFLLQKLYSPNLKEEFRTYMHNTYPWNYASYYINTEKTRAIAIWVAIALAILFFLIGFSIFYKKEYHRNYFSYLLPILYFMLGVSYIFIIYFYFTNPYGFTTWIQYLAIHVICLLIASLMSLSLMLFDNYIIKNSMNFTIQVILKMSFTFFIGVIPIFIVVLAENNNQPWFRSNPIIFILFLFAIGRGTLLYLDYFSENLIKEKDLELSKLKEVNAQAEVRLLQSQINPHFLYNALNSIASLAHKNAEKTEKMALSLSDLFKYTINRKGKKDSTIGDEVEMVKNYLEVEQIRFDDRLRFTIDVDKDLENTKIPMFLIQPLIENAVKHGISKVENNGQISLQIHNAKNGFTIIVEDNGRDFPEGLVSGHGLQTVFDLLRLTYGDNASLSWKNKPKKYIKITIEN